MREYNNQLENIEENSKRRNGPGPFYNKEQFLRKYERLRILRRNMQERDKKRLERKFDLEKINILDLSWGGKTSDFEVLAKEDLYLKNYNVPKNLVKANSNFNDYYKLSNVDEIMEEGNKGDEEYSSSSVSGKEEEEQMISEEVSKQSGNLEENGEEEEEEIGSPSFSKKTSKSSENSESKDTISLNYEGEFNIIKEESKESESTKKNDENDDELEKIFNEKIKKIKSRIDLDSKTSLKSDSKIKKVKKQRRKLGDQISIKPVYIDFSKESQKYSSYWMDCIENSLKISYLDLHEYSFGYDTCFGKRIDITRDEVKGQIFYSEENYIVAGFRSYFKIMRRCHTDTEREDEYFKNHDYDLREKSKDVSKNKDQVKFVKKKEFKRESPRLSNTSNSVRDSLFGSGNNLNFMKMRERRKNFINTGFKSNSKEEKEREGSFSSLKLNANNSPRKNIGIAIPETRNILAPLGAQEIRNRSEINGIIYQYLKRNGVDFSDDEEKNDDSDEKEEEEEVEMKPIVIEYTF